MKLSTTALALFLSLTTHSQSNTYLADLRKVRSVLENTPSYKDQIKGDALVSFNALFHQLEKDSTHPISSFRYFENLARLFFPIRDNHLGFYQVAVTNSGEDFPRFTGNIDSLSGKMSQSPPDSIEGIYYYDTAYTVGLFKTGDKEYTGVVLHSNIPIWRKGQIAIHLYETEPGYYKAIYAHPRFKTYNLYSVEKFVNHSLVNSSFYQSFTNKVYSKKKIRQDHVNIPVDMGEFVLKHLDAQTQYLFIRHFSADREKMRRSDSFYVSIKDSLTASNLVVDLRNNDGGAMKVSRKFLNLLREYAKRGSIYVLVNNGTMSQGEIFTLQLKELGNVRVLGQTTRGTLVYGSNYGNRERLPSGVFEIYPTDMGADQRLVPYEVYGVKPDILLNNDSDWIGQAMKYIVK